MGKNRREENSRTYHGDSWWLYHLHHCRLYHIHPFRLYHLHPCWLFFAPKSFRSWGHLPTTIYNIAKAASTRVSQIPFLFELFRLEYILPHAEHDFPLYNTISITVTYVSHAHSGMYCFSKMGRITFPLGSFRCWGHLENTHRWNGAVLMRTGYGH